MKRLSRFDFGAFLIITLLLVGLVYNSYSVGSSPRVVDPDLIPWIDPATGAINVTKVYASVINATTGYVQIYKLIVENGTSFPASATAGYVFYYTPLNSLYFYNGSSWNGIGSSATIDYSSLTGKPDLSVVLCQNGSRPLLNNWNVGNYGIYALTYVSTVGTVYCSGLSNVTLGGYVNTTRLLVEVSASGPSLPTVGYVYFDTAQNNLFIYNGTGWIALGNATTPTSPDLSVYLFDNGTRPLTANWNVGSFGLYGLTYVNTTTLYCTTIDALVAGTGVKVLKLVVENGTSFPVSPVDRQVFFHYSSGYLYMRNNSVWIQVGTTAYGNLSGTPDLTVYLTKNGATALSGNWNVGGSYGIYGATWVNGTSISSNFWYQNGVNVTDVLAYPQQLWSYMIFQSGSNYFMKNGTTGQVDYSSTNLTLVEQYAKGNLTSGLIYLKEVVWNTSLGSPADNVMIVQQIQGEIRYISSQAKFVVPQLGADPNTTGWTQTEQGRLWFNTGEDTMKYWNGSAIVSFPSIGGGSVANGTYTLPYSFTIYKSGSTYYAENSNGGVPYSSATFSTVWTSVLGALSNGGTIKMKPATYTVTTTLGDGDRNNIEVRCEEGVKLVAQNSLLVPMLQVIGQHDWNWYGGELDGNKANQGNYTGDTTAMEYNDCYDCDVDGVYMHDFLQFGFRTLACTNCGIRNSHVAYVLWNGIYVGSGSWPPEHGYAINNFVEHSADIGIALAANYSICSNNRVRDCNDTGGSSDWDAYTGIGIRIEGPSYGCIVENNVVENCATGGIYINNAQFCKISGNIIQNTDLSGAGAYAIYASTTSYSMFDNNIIYNTGTGGGLQLNTNCDYNDVKGNKFAVCPVGLHISNANDDQNFVDGNNFDACTDDIVDSGTSTRWGNNLWKDGSYDNTPP